MDDTSRNAKRTEQPSANASRLAADVEFEDIRAANDNDQEPRPIETGRGHSEMTQLSATAIPFNDADFKVFEALEHQLSEAMLIGDSVTEQTEDCADFLLIRDLHDIPLWIIEKHGADTWIIWSEIGDHAMAIHGSAHSAADAVIEMVTFPRNP